MSNNFKINETPITNLTFVSSELNSSYINSDAKTYYGIENLISSNIDSLGYSSKTFPEYTIKGTPFIVDIANIPIPKRYTYSGGKATTALSPDNWTNAVGTTSNPRTLFIEQQSEQPIATLTRVLTITPESNGYTIKDLENNSDPIFLPLNNAMVIADLQGRGGNGTMQGAVGYGINNTGYITYNGGGSGFFAQVFLNLQDITTAFSESPGRITFVFTESNLTLPSAANYMDHICGGWYIIWEREADYSYPVQVFDDTNLICAVPNGYNPNVAADYGVAARGYFNFSRKDLNNNSKTITFGNAINQVQGLSWTAQSNGTGQNGAKMSKNNFSLAPLCSTQTYESIITIERNGGAAFGNTQGNTAGCGGAASLWSAGMSCVTAAGDRTAGYGAGGAGQVYSGVKQVCRGGPGFCRLYW